jgi:hypothetical protein
MVRQFEERPSDNLIIVLDPGSVPHDLAKRGLGDRSRHQEETDSSLEAAVSLVATVCWEWCRQAGDWLVLGIGGAKPAVLAGTTNRELALAMLPYLAVFEPGQARNAAELPDRLRVAALPAAPVLVVSAGLTDLPDRLADALRRPVAWVNVAAGQDVDFFERGIGHAR